ncbi:MAG: hypothetical protein Q4G28_12135 [Neisseria sp.]|nr:hypothetical protein [Neisseria sp.]
MHNSLINIGFLKLSKIGRQAKLRFALGTRLRGRDGYFFAKVSVCAGRRICFGTRFGALSQRGLQAADGAAFRLHLFPAAICLSRYLPVFKRIAESLPACANAQKIAEKYRDVKVFD